MYQRLSRSCVVGFAQTLYIRPMLVFASCAHSLCLTSPCSIHVHTCIQHLMIRSSRSCITRLEFSSKVLVATPSVAAMTATDSDSMMCAICRQQMVPGEDCEHRFVHSDFVDFPACGRYYQRLGRLFLAALSLTSATCSL